ncbi:molybdopterin cofactor-binding domain-containing protein [Streptomyces sp. NPDC047042]|uniref:molybdopterin cofactor-binding domain-containing protein n=1 Tax=Streptomyces sp. NPDC047042 TaxID=3154807 RepID=UPI0033BFC60D
MLAPFVGGAFGGKFAMWPGTILAVPAARATSRPVRLLLSREAVYRTVGGRTPSLQRTPDPIQQPTPAHHPARPAPFPRRPTPSSPSGTCPTPADHPARPAPLPRRPTIQPVRHLSHTRPTPPARPAFEDEAPSGP